MFVSYHEICSRAYNQFFGEGGGYTQAGLTFTTSFIWNWLGATR